MRRESGGASVVMPAGERYLLPAHPLRAPRYDLIGSYPTWFSDCRKGTFSAGEMRAELRPPDLLVRSTHHALA